MSRSAAVSTPTSDRRFAGKALLVTGGASGLGAAVARRFTAEGGRAAVLDLDPGRAEELAAELEGGVGLGADVSDEGAVARAVAEAAERLGSLDCVVNSAGHVVLRRFEKLRLDEWNRMLAVHVTGTMLVCREALPHLRRSGGGAIVNVSSVGALAGKPYLTAYSAAKAAIIGLSRQLAVELAEDGVRVNVVAPGDVRTSMTAPLYEALGGGDESAGAAEIGASNLLKRVGEPEEVAAAICFLLADEASFFTGSLVVPDGGLTAV
jgi:NAD(P)-dependent dehydrogenase (short-subunit alcohol dehydrogenase family)